MGARITEAQPSHDSLIPRRETSELIPISSSSFIMRSDCWDFLPPHWMRLFRACWFFLIIITRAWNDAYLVHVVLSPVFKIMQRNRCVKYSIVNNSLKNDYLRFLLIFFIMKKMTVQKWFIKTIYIAIFFIARICPILLHVLIFANPFLSVY